MNEMLTPTLQGATETAFSLLTQALVRGTFVLMLAFVVVSVLRRYSAAARHLAWTLSIVGLLLLPLFTLGLPRWEILPAWTGFSVIPELNPHLRTWLLIAWSAGTGITLFKVATAMRTLAQARRKAKVATDARICSIFLEALSEAKIRRPVTLVLGDIGTIPKTWGVLRPVVQLPGEAVTLSREQIRYAIVHELAHVRRWDALTHLVAEICSAIYWVHPLLRHACGRLREECEYAADDLVLAGGLNPKSYAQELLALAAVRRPRAAAGIPMAHPSQVDGRVASILNAALNRHPATRAMLLVGSTLLLGIELPLAMLGTQPTAPTASMPVVVEPASAHEPHTPYVMASGVVRVERIPPVVGTVLDERGNPVPGARVVLRQPIIDSQQKSRLPSHDLAETKSDEAGQFAFRDLDSLPLGATSATAFPLKLVVEHPDHALAWATVMPNEPTDVRMQSTELLTGSVRDMQGSPVSGAVAKVFRIFSLEGVGRAAGDRLSAPEAMIDLGDSENAPRCTTDENGQFAFQNLPGEIGVLLQIKHPNHPATGVYAAIARDPEQVVVPKSRSTIGPSGPPDTVHINRVEATLEPARIVRVRVTDATTGEPIIGARTTRRVDCETMVLHTDESGRLEFTDRLINDVDFRISPPENSTYVPFRYKAAGAGSLAEVSAPLARGILVTGAVLDRETGRGIPGVALTSEALPIVEGKSASSPVGITDADGRFSLAVSPGSYLIGVRGHVPGYRTSQHRGLQHADPSDVCAIDVSPEAPAPEIELKLAAAPRVTGRVLDPAGQPASDVEVSTMIPVSASSTENYSPTWRLVQTLTDQNGAFVLDDVYSQISGKPESEQVELVFLDRANGLGFSEVLGPLKKLREQRVEVRLQQLASVTVSAIDAESKQPIPDVTLELGHVSSLGDEQVPAHNELSVTTNRSGLARFDTLIPGTTYTVRTHIAWDRIETTSKIRLKPGESVARHIQLHAAAEPTVVPSTADMSAEDAFRLLSEAGNRAHQAYIQARNRDGNQAVRACSPVPAYAESYLRLAQRDPRTDIALQSYLCVIRAELTCATRDEMRWLKREALDGILENFADRSELEQWIDPILAAAPDSIDDTAAQLLIANPHRSVQGRVKYYHAIRLIDQSSRDRSEEKLARGIAMMREAIAEFGDVDVNGDTLGNLCERELERIEQSPPIGKSAPETVNPDLAGL